MFSRVIAISRIFGVALVGLTLPNFVFAADLTNPPFEDDEPFVLTRGYETPATHVGKEQYALDFTQSGCLAFRKPIIAVADGEVTKVNVDDRRPQGGGGYGLFVLIGHSDGIKSRYAHLDEVLISSGEVKAGDVVGLMGNTGHVSGTSCPEYPGLHLHFAMYNYDLSAYKPEPMQKCTDVTNSSSPCTDFTAWHKYKSETILTQEEPKDLIANVQSSDTAVILPSNDTWWNDVADFFDTTVYGWTTIANSIGDAFANSFSNPDLLSANTSQTLSQNDALNPPFEAPLEGYAVDYDIDNSSSPQDTDNASNLVPQPAQDSNILPPDNLVSDDSVQENNSLPQDTQITVDSNIDARGGESAPPLEPLEPLNNTSEEIEPLDTSETPKDFSKMTSQEYADFFGPYGPPGPNGSTPPINDASVPPAAPACAGFNAEYFDNRFLEGVPVFVRCEGAIDYNWQQGSPDASVPVDDFSVRWTGIFPFEDGNYLFFMLTDDGAKIYVDGNVAFNAWLDQAVKAYSVNVPMTVGQHEIRYEYYEHTVNAEFHASWIKL